ncbi:hypothetical protein ACH4ZX_26150 [Streptomyces sp. NPDC020490]|uniref:hypothetical protein n=1 Tax=Streptomyces sp. NPDC020490 TaxID=3365078 RepID=UPI003794718B
MREELILRLRGAWRHAERPDTALIAAALAPFGAELDGVIGVAPGDIRLPVAIPETADLIALGDAVANALALPSPRITFEQETAAERGVAGRGYYCSCGGVDGDHTEQCPRAGT